MGKSYNKQSGKGKASHTPKQWTQVTEHKYCKKPDFGREGKANKAQQCNDCLVIKAQQEKLIQSDTSNRRQEKMAWGVADDDGGW